MLLTALFVWPQVFDSVKDLTLTYRGVFLWLNAIWLIAIAILWSDSRHD